MLIGGNEHHYASNQDANALTVVTPQGAIGGSYAKRQLVPFGEYVPKAFKWLSAFHLTIYDRYRGPDRQPLLDTGGPAGKVGAAICYESSYSRFTQEQVARGANVLVVVSDDTWFGRTPAGDQHADIAALRAVESDRYLIRAAPTGISEIIDPTGRVIARSDLFTAQAAIAPVESRHTMPPFNRYGDWFIWVVAAMTLLALNACLASRPARSKERVK